MSRPEELVTFSLFIERKLHKMTREQRESGSDKISEKFPSNSLKRSRTKNEFGLRHVLNYCRDINCPIVDKETAAVPFVREDGNAVMIEYYKLTIYKELIYRQENSAPGSKANWNNLISFDKKCKSFSTTTVDRTEE